MRIQVWKYGNCFSFVDHFKIIKHLKLLMTILCAYSRSYLKKNAALKVIPDLVKPKKDPQKTAMVIATFNNFSLMEKS